MEEWDIQLMEKAFQNNIDLLMYKRYKDDTNVAIDKTRTTEEGNIWSIYDGKAENSGRQHRP